VARRIESHLIAGPAGNLEALLEEPDLEQPNEIALVCHSHTQHGGTMHNKVVYRLARGLRRTGCVVLRFNYRGVNLSQGEYAKGEGELEDAATSLTWLQARYPTLPYTLAGFSFGSRIVLRLGCRLAGSSEPAPRRIIAVGFPTVYADRTYLGGCSIRKVFIQSTNDQFGPRPEFERVFAGVPDPKELIWVPSEDHFFKGALEEFEDSVAGVL